MFKGVVITPADLNGCDWPEKMRRFGLDTLGIHSPGGDATAVLRDCLTPAFRQRCADAGIRLEYELHAPFNLLPRDLFAVHPEYFPCDIRYGERTPHGNWCSSPEALTLIGDNAARLGRMLAPDTGYHFFWGEDTSDGGWCHCDRCRGLSPSDQYLAGVNAMADALVRDDPDAKAAYLAYFSTLEKPQAVRPRPNVFLEFAPLRRCFRHAIDDPGCAVNRRHWRCLSELLEAFPAATCRILEYWLDSSLFSDYRKPARKPPVAPEIMRRDIRAYRRLGVAGITTFAVYMDGDYFRAYGDDLLNAYADSLK